MKHQCWSHFLMKLQAQASNFIKLKAPWFPEYFECLVKNKHLSLKFIIQARN